MEKTLLVGTSVVIDGFIKGPPNDEIVLSAEVRGQAWSGEVRLAKSLFEEHAAALTDGSQHKIAFWINGRAGGRGRITLLEHIPTTDALGAPNVELRFRGDGPPLLPNPIVK